jgi:hypothetical protein
MLQRKFKKEEKARLHLVDAVLGERCYVIPVANGCFDVTLRKCRGENYNVCVCYREQQGV